MRVLITRVLRRPSTPPAVPPRFRRVIVKLDRLGDAVLALGSMHHLLSGLPPGECLLVIAPAAKPIVDRMFPGVPTMVMPAALGHGRSIAAALRYRHRLNGCAADQVVCLRHQRWDYDELVLSWIPARQHVRVDDRFTHSLRPELRTFDFEGRGLIPCEDALGRTVQSDQPWQSCRELELHRLVLQQALGRELAVQDVLPQLSPGDGGRQDLIVVSPFGSEQIKDFPFELLTAAVDEAQRHLASPVLLIGAQSQAPALNEATARLRRAGIRVLDPQWRLSPRAYVDLVAGAGAVVTTDTATAHIAAAADRRAVILLGGGHYGQFGPWRRSHRQAWVTRHLECFGCSWNCRYPEPLCLTGVDVKELRAATAFVCQTES